MLINLKDAPNGVTAEFIKKEYKKLVAICDANIQAGNYAENFEQTKADMSYKLKEYVLPKRFAQDAVWPTPSAEAKIDSVSLWIAQDSSVSNLEDILANIRRDTMIGEDDVRYKIEIQLNIQA